MSYYDRCKECVGRPVCIRMRDGKMHRGIIDRVDRRQVYLRPLENKGLGGMTSFLYALSWTLKRSHDGILITLVSIPFSFNVCCAATASCTSEPVAISNASGVSLSPLLITYPPFFTPS